MASTGRILVIRGGAIGDFILTLPVLAALRNGLPQARLEVLGYPHITPLALAGGLADAVHSLEAGPLAGFFGRSADLNPRWRDFFAGFAVIVSFLYDPDTIFQENVARCSSAQFLAGPHRPDDTAGLHATRALLKPLERLAIFEADTVPQLRLAEPASSPRGAGAGGRRRLALHPGSGSEQKNWPEARWAELFRALPASVDWDFLLVGGEAEGAKLDRLAALLPRARVQVARSLALADLAMKLDACGAFLGHDSGISHLAAALGLPSLVLWGPTAEAVWRPQGPWVTILRPAGGLASLDVPTVLARLVELTQQQRGL